MGLSTFIGGVHPYEGKELSADKPIQVIQPKGELVYPLSQHIGAPAKPLVAKGDKVLVGQKIAEAGGFISANVICSVSGTVKGIEPRLVANGAIVQSIIVENDNRVHSNRRFWRKTRLHKTFQGRDPEYRKRSRYRRSRRRRFPDQRKTCTEG